MSATAVRQSGAAVAATPSRLRHGAALRPPRRGAPYRLAGRVPSLTFTVEVAPCLLIVSVTVSPGL